MRIALVVSWLLALAGPAWCLDRMLLLGDNDQAFLVAEIPAGMIRHMGSTACNDDPFAAPEENSEAPRASFPLVSSQGLDEVFGSDHVCDLSVVLGDKAIDMNPRRKAGQEMSRSNLLMFRSPRLATPLAP